MKALTLVRTVAYLMAAIAAVDPACVVQRREPVAVEVRTGSRSGAANDAVSELRTRLSRELGRAADLESAMKPSAAILVGGNIDVESIPAAIPVSTVSIGGMGANVSVTGIRTPAALRAGWSTEVRVAVRGKGMTGKTTHVALEEQGVELASTEHLWRRDDETAELGLVYVPAAAGSRELRAIARPLHGEVATIDNGLVSAVTVQDRRLRVLVHEPRPSWTAAFVRRALEEDPDFEVAALARVSKGLEVRAGLPPASITADAIARFDAVVVGAPEELQVREVDVLDAFARLRGGTVVYVPDRQPSGAYASRLRAGEFAETLLPNPSRIAVSTGPPLRGSEFVFGGSSSAGFESLATVEQGGSRRPVIISWASGAGQVIFSGALDAWRFRTVKDGYAQFWRATIGAGAAAAPAPIDVALDRGAVVPGDTVLVRARVRATEFDEESALVTVPAVSARVVGGHGFEEVLRMWPSLEVGEFEARIEAPAAGRYDVQVTLDGNRSADAVLIVTGDAHPADVPSDAMRTVALRTGGVSVDASDLAPLVAHLRGLALSRVPGAIHPARSPWWMLAFVALVSAEWLVRRRRGLR